MIILHKIKHKDPRQQFEFGLYIQNDLKLKYVPFEFVAKNIYYNQNITFKYDDNTIYNIESIGQIIKRPPHLSYLFEYKEQTFAELLRYTLFKLRKS